MFHVRTYNKIAPKGLRRFSADKYEVGPEIQSPDAYILRSHKLHGEEIPASLLAVARAGAGVNNLPVEDYTKRGIVAFNTPGANANAVKELVLAAMLLGSRDIIGGRQFVETLGHMTDANEMSKLLENEKKRFAGNELKGKVLGVVGLGAIGSMVADVALAMGMEVLGYDPALSVEAAWRVSNQVQRKESLNALLMASDYISLHVPAIPATKHLINKDTLALMKPHAALINFARESIVDPDAIVTALEAGKLRQYVCDFPEPVLIGRKGVIALPHIGASTEEAEENCAVMAADQIRDFLENGNITNSVNFPQISMGRVEGTTRITFSNENVAGVLGDVLSIFAEHNVNVVDMMNKSRDSVAYNILDLAVAPSEQALEALRKVKHVIRVRVIPA
ncbi:ACT domain-containing protein [Saccharophagus sp. K07]|jgi:D-3-phosphoglycerate dehydrogenase|uniref:phosphoglycerate dehydrogenase n=1 Tax=Saccharophagus sp. K07 TaxID=2283636 RepID=UPI0016525812|nr:phosphoglycerate dehydrogenase [Saccharophagus sp. K07]MBC6904478.1 ACT domain-containing protein [Saccharophagus sp. K07]